MEMDKTKNCDANLHEQRLLQVRPRMLAVCNDCKGFHMLAMKV